MVNAKARFQRPAKSAVVVQRVHRDIHQRNGCQAEGAIGTGEYPVAQSCAFLAKMAGFGAQHQVREVHRPLVWGHVGALGHVTEVAEVTLFDYLVIVGFRDTIHFQGL